MSKKKNNVLVLGGYDENFFTNRDEMIETIAKDAEGVMTVDAFVATYALINTGGGNQCAWCFKYVTEIENLDEHINEHVKEDEANGRKTLDTK